MNQNHDKPWDARLAWRLVYPWRESSLTPNHLTSLRLLCGVAACAILSQGGYLWTNIGALFFCLSNFLDHADGELARMTGKTSRFGHVYDLVSDAVVNILLFVGMGVALADTEQDIDVLPLGGIAGIAVAGIFHMRNLIEEKVGKEDARQPNAGGVEVEDILYLLPVITLTGQLRPFLVLAAIGAPLYAAWVVREYLYLKSGVNH
jgi:archaetidylinositol phosphate synthase